jgi:hypothetical protein
MTVPENCKTFPTISLLSVCLFMVLFGPGLINAASAQTTASMASSETIPPWTQLTVTNVTVDPQILFTGDTATITITVANTGTDSVTVHRATIIDPDIRLLSDTTYDSVGAIGAGNSRQFTFTVLGDITEGYYYPAFSLEFQGTGYLRYAIPVQVRNAPVILAIQDKPDTYAPGVKRIVTLSASNLRTNTINNLFVVPTGTDADIIPTTAVIGSLGPGRTQIIQFNITPKSPGVLTFDAHYLNGINIHTANLTLPIEFETDKTLAVPVVNNIVITPQGESYKVSGDITNAGLSNANSVTVNAGSPATGVDPYKEYAVGLLKPDDFSSFQLTFSAPPGSSQVPVIVTWKDTNGNVYSSNTQIDLRSTGSGSTSSSSNNPVGRGGFGLFGGPRQGGSFQIPWLELIAGIAVVAVAIFLWRRRKKNRKT